MRLLFTLLLFVFSVLGLKAQDSIPPTITLLGEPHTGCCQYAVYRDAGYDLSDNIDSQADINVEEQGNFLANRTNVCGLYSLRYKATDRSGNISYTGWRMIEVSHPRNGGYGCEPPGFQENNGRGNLTIYPNPTKGIVEVNFHNPVSNIEFRLTDLTGKNIPFTVTKPFLSSFSFSLSGLPPGIYLLRVGTEQGTIVRRIYLEQ